MATAGHEDGIGHAYTYPDLQNNEDAYSLLPFDSEFLRARATSVRNGQTDSGEYSANGYNTALIECTAVLPPISGSYNTAAARGDFDVSAGHSLTTEALTLRFVKNATTIPVPEVQQSHAGLDNSLRYPYILTDFIDGIPLPKVWFDHSTPSDLLQSRCMHELQDLAEAMVQLGKFTFPQGGSPKFDSGERLYDAGPLRTLDIAASLIA
ncbi:hypothetical protein F4859DRAFT_520157 [Xylaria cf. heliscus]|nr:hypothetical protein F4859DRAFT_520157 [Xylaria cf. heliscus]